MITKYDYLICPNAFFLSMKYCRVATGNGSAEQLLLDIQRGSDD